MVDEQRRLYLSLVADTVRSQMAAFDLLSGNEALMTALASGAFALRNQAEVRAHQFIHALMEADKQAQLGWERVERLHTAPGAMWECAPASTLWMLDPREGPMRTRGRLKRCDVVLGQDTAATTTHPAAWCAREGPPLDRVGPDPHAGELWAQYVALVDHVQAVLEARSLPGLASLVPGERQGMCQDVFGEGTGDELWLAPEALSEFARLGWFAVVPQPSPWCEACAADTRRPLACGHWGCRGAEGQPCAREGGSDTCCARCARLTPEGGAGPHRLGVSLGYLFPASRSAEGTIKASERLQGVIPATLVSPFGLKAGEFIVGDHHFYFQEDAAVRTALDELDPHSSSGRAPLPTVSALGAIRSTPGEMPHWPNRLIAEVPRRLYLLHDVALEILLSNGQALFLAFHDRGARELARQLLHDVCGPQVIDYEQAGRGRQRQARLTEEWASGQMSNYEYLMHLNTLAGRSFNDLSQYPVFPWVLSDYTSATLDLEDETVFRDLSRPMGAQTPKRLADYELKYEQLKEMGEVGLAPGCGPGLGGREGPVCVCGLPVKAHPASGA